VSEYQLSQTLLIDPVLPFAELDAVMQHLGWRRKQDEMSTAPLLAGEPELATWTWQGGKPFVIYTFNPVAHLRVLDVATLTPGMRGVLAEQVPLLNDEQVENLLFANDSRERLLGLWAIQEIERIDLIDQVRRLQEDSDPVVAEQARDVAEHLDRISNARLGVLGHLGLLSEAAKEFIPNLSDPKFSAQLQPDKEDFAKLFDAYLAGDLAREVALEYQDVPKISPVTSDATITVTALPAGLLRSSNELSDKFPLAYRDIAGWMTPKRIWLSWTITTPDGGSVRYDGLAWLDDHWVWIPKVYRLLIPLLAREDNEQKVVH